MGAGRGSWDQGSLHELTGYVTADPFPMIRIPEGNGFKTVLLACQTKCGAQRQLAAANVTDDRVTVRGSLIERGRHAMLAAPCGPMKAQSTSRARPYVLRAVWRLIFMSVIDKVASRR